MRNKVPLSVLLFCMLALVCGQSLPGDGHGSAMADDKPLALQQDSGSAQQPPSDVKADEPSQTQAPRNPKEAGTPGDLKPFKPSEEIEADQAVDFPYDI
jgi:hypothetical protein